MEEVQGSNPCRSTKTFNSLTVLFPPKTSAAESKTHLMHGLRVNFDDAHDWVLILNAFHFMGLWGRGAL